MGGRPPRGGELLLLYFKNAQSDLPSNYGVIKFLFFLENPFSKICSLLRVEAVRQL
jgi:hypothetical protein